MNYMNKSVFKALLLSGVVIIAGLGIGSFFMVNKTYPTIDLMHYNFQMKDSSEIVHATSINIFTHAYSVNWPFFYGNTTSLEVLKPDIANHFDSVWKWGSIWILIVEIALNLSEKRIEMIDKETNQSIELMTQIGWRSELKNFLLTSDNMTDITIDLNTTVRTIVEGGNKMSADEFRHLRLNYTENTTNTDRPTVSSRFIGNDGTVVFLEAIASGIAASACTIEQWDGHQVTPPEGSIYYFLPTQDIAESTSVPYFAYWNTILQIYLDNN